jgi:hypothetical protein
MLMCMDKKTKYQITFGLIGAIVFGLIGLLYFAGYGGNRCDVAPAMGCDCFCCGMFGLRGYEACGDFGLILGILLGAIIGVLAAHHIWRKIWTSA